MFWAGIDEVHEASTTVELGKEDSGIGLGFRVLDPLKARPDAAVVTAALAEDSTTIAAHPHVYFFFFFFFSIFTCMYLYYYGLWSFRFLCSGVGVLDCGLDWWERRIGMGKGRWICKSYLICK